MVQSLWQDLHYALRMLGKNRMLTLVIVVSLGIGIGANSAIFSVVDALLLRPLPYPQPDRLAAVWLHSLAIGNPHDWPSPRVYLDVQRENHSFEQMALAQSRVFVLTGRDQPERLFGVRTQSTLLEMLGAKPLLGRYCSTDAPNDTPAQYQSLSDAIRRVPIDSRPSPD